MKAFEYLIKSFSLCPPSKNIPYWNNKTRIIYSILIIASYTITLTTFGFIHVSWPFDYLCVLINKRCEGRK